MEIINKNKDVLHVVFSKLSSYKRSKICTVCSTWYRVLLDTISLIENAPRWIDHFLLGHYHTIVRADLEENDVWDALSEIEVEDLWTYDNIHMTTLYFDIAFDGVWDITYEDAFMLASKGYRKLSKRIFNFDDCNSTHWWDDQRKLPGGGFRDYKCYQHWILRGACKGKHLDMVEEYCDIDNIQVVYDSIVESGNDVNVMEIMLGCCAGEYYDRLYNLALTHTGETLGACILRRRDHAKITTC
jgi:hypothetical protein